MSTFTQTYYHITFSTKDRRRVLDAERREELFKCCGESSRITNHIFIASTASRTISIFSRGCTQQWPWLT